MKSWQRARTEEQVAQRANSILAAAARVFEDVPYDEVTLGVIAGEAGITRTNIYRYFETREAIFLTLYEGDVARWVLEFEVELSHAPTPMEPDQFIDLWTRVVLRQQRLLRLTPLLALSLEKNSSETLYRQFKESTHTMIEKAASLIGPALPALGRDDLFAFFMMHHAMVAGAHPMCHYSEMQRRILATPHLSRLQLDFAAFYKRSMLAYLLGMSRPLPG